MAKCESITLVATVWNEGADTHWELELLYRWSEQSLTKQVALVEGRCDIAALAVAGMVKGFEIYLGAIAKNHDVLVRVPGIDD